MAAAPAIFAALRRTNAARRHVMCDGSGSRSTARTERRSEAASCNLLLVVTGIPTSTQSAAPAATTSTTRTQQQFGGSRQRLRQRRLGSAATTTRPHSSSRTAALMDSAPPSEATKPGPPQRVWLSWSSGKDCSWALHKLRVVGGTEVVGLLTTLNGSANRVAMHAVRAELLEAQAAATGLPVHQVMLPSPCSNEHYQARMATAIEAAKAAGVDAIAFGDLFLQDVREYRERMMAPTGLGTLFPLWTADSGKSTRELAQEMMAGGIKAVLTCIDPKKLPASFAGRQWDAALLAELPEGVDACGENGEFHTYVYDGPMLQQPIAIKVGRTIQRGGFVFSDIMPADYDDALAEAEADAAEAEAAEEAAAAASSAQQQEQVVCPPPPLDASVLPAAAAADRQV